METSLEETYGTFSLQILLAYTYVFAIVRRWTE